MEIIFFFGALALVGYGLYSVRRLSVKRVGRVVDLENRIWN